MAIIGGLLLLAKFNPQLSEADRQRNATEPMAISGIETLPPITVKLK
jgi:hypothetical protein